MTPACVWPRVRCAALRGLADGGQAQRADASAPAQATGGTIDVGGGVAARTGVTSLGIRTHRIG